MGWFASFLYSQFFVRLPVPTKDFSGQTVIVTGSNTGLGLEAARHLSRLNAELIILAVRNQEKGLSAKKSILASTGRAETSIEIWDLDMQSYESIQAFCKRASSLRRLDAVLENAGMITKYFKLVAGFESTVTTNVIGTFLLAFGLLPKLRQSAADFNMQPRLSIVASDLHFVAKFPERHSKDIFAAMNDEKSADMGDRYALTKLIEVFMVRELGSRTSPAVIINCMTPGACKSDFFRENEVIGALIFKVVSSVIARTTEVGSRTLVAGIAAGEESHGKYMADCQVAKPGGFVVAADGDSLQKEIWNQLISQVEKIQPGVSQNI